MFIPILATSPFATQQAAAVWAAITSSWSAEIYIPQLGSRFLKLIRNSKKLLSDMRSNNEVIHDPNHTNVINLDSDDEYGDDEDFMFSLSQMDTNDTSQYFDTSASQNRVPSTQCMSISFLYLTLTPFVCEINFL